MHWICCQIGAREHYAVPRALEQLGESVELLTDVWATQRSRRFLPARWKQRFHPELSTIAVHDWTWSAAVQQGRMKWQRGSLWQRNIQTNIWFQKQVCNVLPKLAQRKCPKPIVFAYSYAALEVFKLAKQLGCRTFLGQIDPGPVEMRLVQQLDNDHGGMKSESPPQSYWDDWHQECELADAIVVNSQWSRTAVIQEGISESKLQVIPLAFESDVGRMETPRDIPNSFHNQRPLRALFLGQAISRKGIFEMVKAIKLLAKSPIEWTIVGGASDHLVRMLRHLPNTRVTGSVSRDLVASYYQQADVFVLPTHSDGFALTQLEAMSHGLPVIASPFCGDVIKNGYNGLILPDVTPRSIAASMTRLLNEPGLLRQLSANARLEPRFSLNSIGRQFVDLSTGMCPAK